MKIAVIGLGYVGFPLACAIAKKTAHEVIGVDVSSDTVEKIKNKQSPVQDDQAEQDIKEVSLSVSTSYDLVKGADIVLVCVPTPVLDNKEPDLGILKDSVRSLLPFVHDDQLIIVESTINPGVCDEEIMPILKESGKQFHLAHCPERIDPGNKTFNVYNIPRNVGASSPQATKKAAEFYREFIDAEINEVSSLKAAEATKIIENTFRDINIAYVNELAKSFDVMGLDILEVIKGASNKPFAFMPHFPGCGVGGHCIPVDPYYLIKKAKDLGFEHEFLVKAREVNSSMPQYTVKKLVRALNELGLPVKGTKIGLLGLSYKANTNDLRESPALIIKKELEELGADLYVCDPQIEGNKSLDETLNKCTAVLLATAHDEFTNITDWKNIKLIVDGRNCLDKENILEKGIVYKGIGR